MSPKKKYISIALVIVLLGASGLILYQGFGAKPKPQPKATTSPATPAGGIPQAPANADSPPVGGVISGQGAAASRTGAAANSGAQILPYGNRLDFTALKKYNPDGKLFSYPVVSPEEIGPALGDIVRTQP
jgi:hypothetical protein